jgi:predicted nucleic acid-binding protein
MPRTIIADTSCLIVLTKISELDLLKRIYGEVVVTTAISSEYGQQLPEWVEIADPQDHYRQQILELQLDSGEASAIALAMETSDSTIILDDYKARRVAQQLGLRITGTIGVIVRAKLQGLIPSIKPLIDKIKTTDFRVSEMLEMQALREAGEYEQG